MSKARLIKKTSLSEIEQPALSVQQASESRPSVARNAQVPFTQWVRAFRDSRSTNPRASFAALFAAEAKA
ncbi:MAG: hypothetical protein JST85_28785 [Acidobacteria bacterium]|nr:hypothetical protein [Acidobacteriota bacterium]